MARFTIGRLLLLIAALCFALAALKGNHIWFNGMSLLTVLTLLTAAIGDDVRRPAATRSR